MALALPKALRRLFEQRKKNRFLRIAYRCGLTLKNLISREAVTSPDGPVVCLTSYGHRLNTVHLTIESIARGSLKPSRLILWVATGDAVLAETRSLTRLKSRGLEVRLCHDYGSHKKYFPYVLESRTFAQSLVTADDDVFYPPWWLRRLAQSNAVFPDAVICFRAHRVRLTNEGFAPYDTWPECTTPEPSILNFATGVSGVLYPPKVLTHLKEAGDVFMRTCPKADDIWLHSVTVSAGTPVAQILPRPVHFVESINTRSSSLHLTNVKEGGNDIQIAATYSTDTLNRLREALET